MFKLNIRLTSVMVITAVAVIVLLAFSERIQASLGQLNEARHCVTFLEPVAEGSAESSESTDLGCYETFEEAISVATGSEADQSHVSSSKGDHCVIHLSPVPLDSGRLSKSTFRGCYETFAEAILVGTNGAVKLDSDLLPEELTQEMLEVQKMGRASSDVLVGTNYGASGFGSWLGTANYFGPGPCTPSEGYLQPSMPSGWNDAVSSARSYSGCHQFIHYEHLNYAGTSITCDMGKTCQTMGIMNNRTSSFRLTH